MKSKRLPPILACVAMTVALVFGLGAGCKRAAKTSGPAPERPTIRLYVLSTVAGALEPCGCQKDMLGGVDHAAALIEAGASEASSLLVLGAGPMLFMDPALDKDRKAQDLWKAEALARSFKDMHLAGWAPGANDLAAGKAQLQRLVKESGGALLAANVQNLGEKFLVLDKAGYKVGVAGVSEPTHPGGAPVSVAVTDPEASLRASLSDLRKAGAQITIGLVATERGRALRLAERVKGFDVLIVGKAYDRGEGNDAPFEPVMVERTLVVQAPNHLQAMPVVDLFVRDGAFDFADGTGLAAAEQRRSLDRRIAELTRRIIEWERASVTEKDLAERRRDLERLKAERASLTAAKTPPEDGSFFRYSVAEVRERVGSAPKVAARMKEYYSRVNEHNREAFKDLKPEPVGAGQSGYLGVEDCANCHEEEHAFWKTTAHASAYRTLTKEHKEFNLDCVACHVTGYERPGGSTVTHVEGLKDVQCEVCHGPGSRHEDDPENPALIVTTPPNTLCERCHHPPHVAADWSAAKAWPHILGPGHGDAR